LTGLQDYHAALRITPDNEQLQTDSRYFMLTNVELQLTVAFF